MGLVKLQPDYTVEEYLAFEREAEERHEYLDGLIYAMAGESGEHADISHNLSGLLFNELKGKDCRAREKDTRFAAVRCPSKNTPPKVCIPILMP